MSTRQATKLIKPFSFQIYQLNFSIDNKQQDIHKTSE